jgi:hypothetical protein
MRASNDREAIRGRAPRRVALLIALGLSLIAGLWLLRRPRVREPLPAPRLALTAQHVDSSHVQVAVSRPVRAAARPAPEPRPIIDEVSVEKPEVCAGEENLIRVKAHTANGTDADLHYVIGGQAGNPVPLRSYRADDGPPPARRISVFGRGNVANSIEVPAFRVKDCGEIPLVLIKHRLRANAVDELVFSIDILHPPRDFEALQFDWRFGDGSSTTTREPMALHSYAARSQSALYSHFLAKSTWSDAPGGACRGAARSSS